jgi:alginate O-acetyltransferase complex protein AlgI
VQFTSLEFLFLFFPVVWAVYFCARRVRHSLAMLWLTLASLAFYACWRPPYLILLLVSIAWNYGLGRWLVRHEAAAARHRRLALILGIGGDLALLGYYKYFDFLLSSLHPLFHRPLHLPNIILPLGISFFTFTQIAFLVDAYQKKIRHLDGMRYTLFVSYFPHLMAGPIIHHQEIMPQFSRPEVAPVRRTDLAVGLGIFTIGLAKKILIADTLASYATAAFGAVDQGSGLNFAPAWIGALAFTLQLYFDFSGYTDMAIGISRCFGIKLPLNFNSPYKALSIVDFWQRWHMTLSRFLRDYLYIPLGGNRRGPARRYLNLMVTMLLGGLWHGANWTFVVWGGLHGLYLVINHAWENLTRNVRLGGMAARSARLASWALTFLAVVIGWVFLKADSTHSAGHYLGCMAGLYRSEDWWQHHHALRQFLHHAHIAPVKSTLPKAHLDLTYAWQILLPALAIALFCPNTQEIFRRYRPALGFRNEWNHPFLAWHPTWPRAVGLAALLFVCVFVIATSVATIPFLYFRF